MESHQIRELLAWLYVSMGREKHACSSLLCWSSLEWNWMNVTASKEATRRPRPFMENQTKGWFYDFKFPSVRENFLLKKKNFCMGFIQDQTPVCQVKRRQIFENWLISTEDLKHLGLSCGNLQIAGRERSPSGQGRLDNLWPGCPEKGKKTCQDLNTNGAENRLKGSAGLQSWGG